MNYADIDITALISILILGGIFYFVIRNANRKNTSPALAFDVYDASTVSEGRVFFDDVAGNIEAKESVQELVDFIKNPEKYGQYGARIPRGILFYGPPGTGKTLLARAVAGEAEVPFYAVSGSDFVQMYVGVGAGRIRDLFKKARTDKRAVIFIDEIDALGKKRSSYANGSADERDQTLNALLTEMSGFDSGEGVLVIAATNRLDTLDEALLRPGRFDRQIEIGLPDFGARHQILEYHGRNKPFAPKVDLQSWAKETVCFSGAMLENLLNEAAIVAAKNETDYIVPAHLEKAFYTILAGAEKKDRSRLRPQDKKITAYHEAGHGLVAKIKTPEHTLSKITIIPSTKGAGGFCVNIPTEQFYYTKKELESQMMVSLGGRAAEELIFGPDNITTGAGNDIQRATNMVKDYVEKYGMGHKTGLLDISAFRSHQEQSITECAEILEKLYTQTKDLLQNNLSLLHKIAEELLQKETLREEDLHCIFQR